MFSFFRRARAAPKTPDPVSLAHGAMFQSLFGEAAAAPAGLVVSAATRPPGDDLFESIDALRDHLERLVEQEAYAEVETLIARLPGDLDSEPWLLRAGIRLFTHRGQHDRALQTAGVLQQAAPDAPEGYLAACQALIALGRRDDADTMAARGLDAGARSAELIVLAAEIAETTGADERAQARWAILRDGWPGMLEGYVRPVALSMRHGQHLATARVLALGLARFPDEPSLLLPAARDAVRSQQWESAVRLWDAVATHRPDDRDLAFEAAICLLGEPSDRKKRLPQLIARLEAFEAKFAGFAPASTARIDALRELGRLEQAAALGETARAQFRGDVELALACARVAESQELYGRAVTLIDSVRGEAAAGLKVACAHIRALSLADDREAAEQACAAALQRFAGEYGIIEQYVLLASRTADFAEAARRAEHWRALHPRNIGIAKLAERMVSLDSSDVLTGASANSEMGRLFARFESLGATFGGCEFGTIQSHFGAEPISLLRWGNMRVAGLSRALQTRFEGLGDPAHTQMVEQAAGNNASEYFIRDDRYSYWAHTFIKTDEAPRARVFGQVCRRLVFLRRKLIEDLETAEKIFVFKVSEFDGLDELAGLFASIRDYGPCTLLCAVLEDAAHPAGSVEMLQPGLFIGRVGMFGNALGQTMRGMDFKAWAAICGAVATWHDGRR